MTRRLVVELRRFFWRRLTRVATLGLLAIVAMALFSTQQSAADSTPSRVQEHVQAQRQQCESAPSEARRTDPTTDLGRAQITADSFGPESGPPAYPAVTLLLRSLALLLAMVGFTIGAGFLAAEFTTGSIGSWLSFEPRRPRVHLSKLLALALGMVPLALAVVVVVAATAYLVTGHYGFDTSLTAAQREDLVWTAARVVGIASAAAGGGVFVGGLLRPNFQAWVENGYRYLADTYSRPKHPVRAGRGHREPGTCRRLLHRRARARRDAGAHLCSGDGT